MQYLGDDHASLRRRSIVVILARVRQFGRNASEVDKESGVCLIRPQRRLGRSYNPAHSGRLSPLMGELRKGVSCSQVREDALGRRVDLSGFRAQPLSGHRGILKGNDGAI